MRAGTDSMSAFGSTQPVALAPRQRGEGKGRGAPAVIAAFASRSQRPPLSLGPTALDLSPPSRGEVKIGLPGTDEFLRAGTDSMSAFGSTQPVALAPRQRGEGKGRGPPAVIPAFASRSQRPPLSLEPAALDLSPPSR